MKESHETLMQAAAELSAVAGATALRHFRTGVDVETKADGTPVTLADRAAERAARDWLAERFPRDSVLGEEFGGARDPAARCWLIDPIDGTKSFVAGVPLWGTIIAVMEGGEVLAGALAFPAAGESLAAGRGCGAWSGGERAQVSTTVEIGDAHVLATDLAFGRRADRRGRWLELAAASRVARTWGDAYGYLLVATGRAEVMVDPSLAPWDAAPVGIAIEEAGGVFTDWSGRRDPLADGAIATNAALASAARRVLVSEGTR